MKKYEHGCSFCTDLRNIEPAKYISGGSEQFQKFINRAKEQKKFIIYLGNVGKCGIVDRYPKCGYEFTEEDYDSYEDY